jgi:hypothetical protein
MHKRVAAVWSDVEKEEKRDGVGGVERTTNVVMMASVSIALSPE